MKILVTNYFIFGYTGSEIFTYDLSRELKSLGHTITVATFILDSPFREHFNDHKIPVVNVLYDSQLENEKFDLIWAHHSVVLNWLLFEMNVSSKKIIYMSLSPFANLEVPPIYANDLSLILSNSIETKKKLIDEGVTESKIKVLNNSVTSNFFRSETTSHSLKRIAIVGNQINDEIVELFEIFKNHGIQVAIYGNGYLSKLIEPDDLDYFDLVLSIGRTVQYCFALKKPIYIYGPFGGPGYLTKENFKESEIYNFSGRSHPERKSSQELFKDITSNYNTSLLNLMWLYEQAKVNYNLRKNINEILDFVKVSQDLDLEAIVKKHLIVKRINKSYADFFFETMNHHGNYNRQLQELRTKIKILEGGEN